MYLGVEFGWGEAFGKLVESFLAGYAFSASICHPGIGLCKIEERFLSAVENFRP